MASEKEEIILDFKVDSGDLLKEATASKKAILDVKDAQRDLNKEFAKGTISVEEYAAESVQLEQKLKKQQENYKNTTKLISTQSNSINALTAATKKLKEERNNLDLGTTQGLKRLDDLNKMIDKNDKALQKNVSLLEKQKINIGNYASAIDLLLPGTANLVNQVSGLSSALAQSQKAITATGFSLKTLNTIPVLALVSSLVGVFNLLSIAAKASADEIYRGFTFIQDQEKAIKRLAKETDNYVDSIEAQNNLLSALGKRDLEILKNEESANVIRQAAQKSKIDLIKEELNLLTQRQNVDLSTITEETFNRQISLTKAIQDSGKSEEEYLKLKREELETEQKALILLQNQNTIIGVKLTNQRIADTEEAKRETERLAALKEEARLRELVARQGGRNVSVSGIDASNLDFNQPDENAARRLSEEEKQRTIDLLKGTADFELELNKQILRGREKLADDTVKLKKQEAEAFKKYEQEKLQATEQFLGALSGVFEEGSELQKVFALSSIGIDTAEAISALTAASEQNPANGFTFGGAGIAQFLTGLARITANIATAKNYLGFADGGYTGFGGKYDPAGIVHRNEVVWNQTDVALSGGPQAVDRMRPTYRPSLRGYADGGIVTAPAQETNNAILTANAFRNAPAFEVSVVEIIKMSKRVNVKSSESKITNRSKTK